jgi:signal recognition particle receptor subunit beta
MVSINYAFKEIISKIVYYGPGLSGKTTNLQYVFKKVPKDTRGEMISLATDADRTLYFDFLPVNVGTIRGFSTKFQLYTVPGQVYYNATRKLVLRGVDGLVFVADSQLEKMDENIESMINLEENLAEYGYNITEIPLVIQYNKRDLPNIATIEKLQNMLNTRGLPYFEAVATTGQGVFATLKAISKMVLDKARKTSTEKHRRAEPVVVSASGTTEAEARAKAIETGVSPAEQISPEKLKAPSPEKEEPAEKPAIVSEYETMTNVVVSTPTEDVEEEEEEKPPKEDLEETTEHSVLKDESDEAGAEITVDKKHPDVLDADKISRLDTEEEIQQEAEQADGFEEEVTVVSDPHQIGQLLAKPQMAKSTRVKGKRKFPLFGWLKKKKHDDIKEDLSDPGESSTI